MFRLNFATISTALLQLQVLLLPSAIFAKEPAQGPIAIQGPIVIAHRGASGYLPEHTEGAKVLALAQGADYVEQDVVLSKDGVFVVTHDITMESTTNVAEKFKERIREDGKYYFADFTWPEIQSLEVHERTDRTGKQAFENRFPPSYIKCPRTLSGKSGCCQTLIPPSTSNV